MEEMAGEAEGEEEEVVELWGNCVQRFAFLALKPLGSSAEVRSDESDILEKMKLSDEAKREYCWNPSIVAFKFGCSCRTNVRCCCCFAPFVVVAEFDRSSCDISAGLRER